MSVALTTTDGVQGEAGRNVSGPLRYAGGQLLKCASLIFAVSALTFFLAKVSPMDPVVSYLGAENAVDPSQYEALSAKWGLDRPAVEQFALWWGNALHGDLGTSLMLQRPVAEVIAEGLRNSLLLLVTAWLASGILGGALGVVAGKNRGRWPDRLISSICYVFAALPTFWFGLLMLLLFAVHLGWFPIGLSTSAGVALSDSTLGERLHHMILPALTLSVSGVSSIALQTRARLVQESESDYALFAAGRGEGPWRFVLRHGLRNCLKPFVTLQFGSISEVIGGSVLAETVFSYAGLGALTSMAGTRGDLPLLIGITLISATIVFIGNLIANLLYPVIDPRIRQEWA
jgi:peptide/nickel transport system permease protein